MTDAARDANPTEVLPRDLADEPRRRRAGRVWIALAVIVAVLVALLVVVDVVLRNLAEQQVATQVRAQLPQGVDGDVDVSIGGFSVIAQYLSGTMDRVELRAPELVVEGAPLDVDVVLEGVPVDLAATVRSIEATIEGDQATINDLITIAGIDGGLTLGDGAVEYRRSIEVLGIPLAVEVTSTPRPGGDSVLLESVGVELVAGGGSIDVSDVANQLVGGEPLAICVAEYLPAGVEVTGITVTPGRARVELAGSGLRLDAATLEQRGTCG